MGDDNDDIDVWYKSIRTNAVNAMSHDQNRFRDYLIALTKQQQHLDEREEREKVWMDQSHSVMEKVIQCRHQLLKDTVAIKELGEKHHSQQVHEMEEIRQLEENQRNRVSRLHRHGMVCGTSAVLGLLLAVWLMGQLGGVDASAGMQLSAYDCEASSNIRSHKLPTAVDCKTGVERRATMERYLLVQRVAYHDLEAWRCTLTTSRFDFRCGFLSHLSWLRHPRIEYPIRVSSSDCRGWAQGRLRLEGVTQTILPDQEVIVVLDKHGELLELHGSVSWLGEETKLASESAGGNPAEVEEQVLTFTQYRARLEKVTIRTNFKKNYVLEDQEILGCDTRTEACETASWTYVWKIDKPLCNMRQLHELEGQLTQQEDGGTVFIDQQQRLRLSVEGDERSYCNGQLSARRTNFKNFFLAQIDDSSTTLPLLKVSRLSVADWVTSRDDFIISYFEHRLEEQGSDSDQRSCREALALTSHYDNALAPAGG